MTFTRRSVTALAAVALALPATALAATRGVAVKDNVFSQRSLTVSRGTTVRWTWKGHGLHNVTVVRGPVAFRSSTKRSGTYSHRFTRAGTYVLVCSVHAPGMKMTVRVR
jgi:plastocyanin